MQTFESYLQEEFMVDWSDRSINKDNCEDLFSAWLRKKNVNQIMDRAEKWGKGLQDKLEIAMNGYKICVDELKKINEMAKDEGLSEDDAIEREHDREVKAEDRNLDKAEREFNNGNNY